MSKKRSGSGKFSKNTSRKPGKAELPAYFQDLARREQAKDRALDEPGFGYVSGKGRVGTREAPMVGTLNPAAAAPGSYITHAPDGTRVLLTNRVGRVSGIATDESQAARVRINFDTRSLTFLHPETGEEYGGLTEADVMPFSDPGNIATVPSLYVFLDKNEGDVEHIAPGEAGSYAAQVHENGVTSVAIINPKGPEQRGTVAAQLDLLPGSTAVRNDESGEIAVWLFNPKGTTHPGKVTIGRYPLAADHVVEGKLKRSTAWNWHGKSGRLVRDGSTDRLSVGKTPIDMNGGPHVPILNTTQYGVTTATQVLEEMAKLYDMMRQPSWRHLVEDYYVERVLMAEVDSGWKPTPQESDLRLRLYKDIVLGLSEALPDMTPYLWRSEVWSLTNELAASYPEGNTWSLEMLHSPLMYWAMEHDVLLQENSSDPEVQLLRSAGFTGAFSMIVGQMGVYYHKPGEPIRDQNKDVISQVWMMICPELGTPVPMPTVMTPGELVGKHSPNERALAAKLSFLFSKLPEIKHETAGRGTRKRWEKQSGGKTAPDLRMVALRQRERPARDPGEDGGSTIDYSCRWMVRSHWHKYHTREGVITKLLGDYIKGPDDKPLRLKSDRIYNVGR